MTCLVVKWPEMTWYDLSNIQVFSHAVGKHNDRQALGTRVVLAEEKEAQPDGKVGFE